MVPTWDTSDSTIETDYYCGWKRLDSDKGLGAFVQCLGNKQAIFEKYGLVISNNDNIQHFAEKKLESCLFDKEEHRDYNSQDPDDENGGNTVQHWEKM